MDKTLVGYQGHIGNEETVINPKDKEVPKYWDGIGTLFGCAVPVVPVVPVV
jgi:hypothetical protein